MQWAQGLCGNLVRALRERSRDCAICRFSQAEGDGDIQQVLLYPQQPRLGVARPSATRRAGCPRIDSAPLSDMDWLFPPPTPPSAK